MSAAVRTNLIIKVDANRLLSAPAQAQGPIPDPDTKGRSHQSEASPLASRWRTSRHNLGRFSWHRIREGEGVGVALGFRRRRSRRRRKKLSIGNLPSWRGGHKVQGSSQSSKEETMAKRLPLPSRERAGVRGNPSQRSEKRSKPTLNLCPSPSRRGRGFTQPEARNIEGRPNRGAVNIWWRLGDSNP